MMTRMLKPSPNEALQMLQDETQRRRKLRILQVREQEKMTAIRIRRAMQEKHDKEIDNLANVLKKKWTKDHQEALKKSEEKFATCLKDVGSAHEEAKENAPNQAMLNAIAEENRKAAKERGDSALEHQRQIRRMQEEESIEKRRMRHVALIKEKLRAKHIAKLPLPLPNPADTYLDSTGTTHTETISTGSIPHQPGRYATIQVSDHECTMPAMVSLGLPSNAVVERATAAETAMDAREEAEKEGERINLLQAERDRAVQECMEKAKVRHQAALDQARLDRESKELMNDLKQLKMKDALRRQHHIEYKWDDNAKGKKACQELFGPPGSKFKESELFSRDLKRSKEREDSSSFLEDASDGLPSGSQDTTAWTDVSHEEEKKPKEKALNRLLKQIEVQRQKKKQSSDSTSSSSETGNFRTEFNLQEDSNEASESSQNSDSTPPGKQARESTQEIMHPAATTSEKDATEPKQTISTPNLASLEPVSQGLTANSKSPSKSPKVVQENAPSVTLVEEISKSSSLTKSQSESLLEKSLENMRNDEALLKSVKDFQERLLQQHKSCAKIQEQIHRLERKKATIDSLVADVTKPKSF